MDDMNQSIDSTCAELEPVLVDFVDGALGPRDAARVKEHCSSCSDCAGAVDALREIPSRLLEERPSPASWEAQRQRIMEQIDEIQREDAARREGFDLRVILPLAAAVLIALAGIVSLQSVGRDVPGAMPARAALLFAMEDPAVRMELFETLGEPLLLSEPASIEDRSDVAGNGWPADGFLGEVEPPLRDLDEDEAAELEQILGVEMTV
jgi:hypothetical protein